MLRKSVCLWACAVLALSLFASTAARAASINYGNSGVIAPGVQFLGITESSSTDAVPLFGAPASYFPVGIDFNPASFGASGLGGAGDFTDGQLNFSAVGTFTPTVKVAITDVYVAESGDYSLVGVGTNATRVIAGVSIHVTVTEIDGVPLAVPVALGSGSGSLTRNLVSHAGVVQPWSFGLSYNVAGQLTALNIPYAYGATKIEVVVDNNLIALSESGTGAFIAKKDFKVSTINNVVLVPEPAGMCFIALAAIGTLTRRRLRA